MISFIFFLSLLTLLSPSLSLPLPLFLSPPPSLSLSPTLLFLAFYSSTGFFVFGYAMFYYYKRSHMYGTLQTVEFFGYTILSCYIFFLMIGTASFFASLMFVKYIYRNLKMDYTVVQHL